jgi:glucokinase
VSIVRALGEKTGLPCFLENDANACALAEWRWGAGRGIALLIDILNPQCIVLGSIFVRSEGLFRGIVESVVAEETLAASRRQCVIRPALLGELLGDKAALGVAVNGLLSTPSP